MLLPLLGYERYATCDLATILEAYTALQVDAIADKPNIVVATPGRLLEMATEGLINLGAYH